MEMFTQTDVRYPGSLNKAVDMVLKVVNRRFVNEKKVIPEYRHNLL